MNDLVARDLAYRVNGAGLVDGISLEARAGELLAIVGPNGAGKSTLLGLLAGDLPPSSGEVRLGGETLGKLKLGEVARRRAVMSQEHVLQFAFSVLDVVLMGRYPLRSTSTRDDDVTAARTAMETAGVAGLASRLYPTLSGGEKTRTAFARALAQEAPVLLLDEPTGNLDVRHQELVAQVLEGLAGAGVVVVAVLHDLNLAARYADRMALLDRGRLAAVGTTAEVLDSTLLSRVYGHPITVMPHPERDCPLVLVRDVK